MLDVCSNPRCSTPFQYLRSGRVLRILHPPEGAQEMQRIEHFWLCGRCMQEYEMTWQPSTGLTLHARTPRFQQERRRATEPHAPGAERRSSFLQPAS